MPARGYVSTRKVTYLVEKRDMQRRRHTRSEPALAWCSAPCQGSVRLISDRISHLCHSTQLLSLALLTCRKTCSQNQAHTRVFCPLHLFFPLFFKQLQASHRKFESVAVFLGYTQHNASQQDCMLLSVCCSACSRRGQACSWTQAAAGTSHDGRHG